MTDVSVTIGCLAAATAAIKAAGPVALGGRKLSGWTIATIALLAPALLAALVVVETFAREETLVVDARAAGVAAAAIALALRASLPVAVTAAALVAALARAAG